MHFFKALGREKGVCDVLRVLSGGNFVSGLRTLKPEKPKNFFFKNRGFFQPDLGIEKKSLGICLEKSLEAYTTVQQSLLYCGIGHTVTGYVSSATLILRR